MRGLSGKAAIVTGGAKNIGRAITLRLAADGVAVLIAGRDRAAAETLTEEIRWAGGRACAARCDVTDPAEVEAAVAQAVAAFGGVDIW